MFCSGNARSCFFYMILAFSLGTVPAFADDVSGHATTQSPQLGKAEFNTQVPEPAASFRIKREPVTAKLFGNIEKNTSLSPRPYLNADPSLDSPVKANDYAGLVQNSLSATAATNETKTPKGNYVWGQSAAGGYFDATGQIKELVMGDQLFKFGGKFMDGTAVPTTPVVCNFKGHVYKPYVVKRNP